MMKLFFPIMSYIFTFSSCTLMDGWTICSMCYVYIKVFLFHSNLSSPAPKWMDHPFNLLYITLLTDVLGLCVKGQVK